MHWIKLTAKTGHLIHVNLANAMSVIWNQKENASYIAFPGGREDVLVVIETPEKILKKLELDKEILADQDDGKASDFAKAFPDTTK